MIVSELIERGMLDDWTWIGLYRMDYVWTFGAGRETEEDKETEGQNLARIK